MGKIIANLQKRRWCEEESRKGYENLEEEQDKVGNNGGEKQAYKKEKCQKESVTIR